MKLMDQSLFDVIALTLARARLVGEAQHEQMRAGILNAYRSSFKDDDLWYTQATEAASRILSKFPPEKWGESYEAASQYRRTLDGQMKPLTLWSRIAGGTIFMRSHPQPEKRVMLCEQNVLRCLTVISLAQVRQLDGILRKDK